MTLTYTVVYGHIVLRESENKSWCCGCLLSKYLLKIYTNIRH